MQSGNLKLNIDNLAGSRLRNRTDLASLPLTPFTGRRIIDTSQDSKI